MYNSVLKDNLHIGLKDVGSIPWIYTGCSIVTLNERLNLNCERNHFKRKLKTGIPWKPLLLFFLCINLHHFKQQPCQDKAVEYRLPVVFNS